MRLKLFIPLLTMIFSILACGASATPTTISPTATITAIVDPPVENPATQDSPVTEASPATESAPAEPTQVTADGHFFNLRFSPEQYRETYTAFPTGLEEIFARWEYAGMQPGMLVKREWLHEGAEWVTVEEEWAEERESGRLYGISIYDHINGLEPGTYTLNLYVDGVLQTGLENTFEIGEVYEMEKASPDGAHTAVIHNWTLLEVDGVLAAQANRIYHFSWFPDGEHILYDDRIPDSDATQQGPPGPRYRTWLANINTGESTLFTEEEDFLHAPEVSPDGGYVAMMAGNGYGDACFSGFGIRLMPLNGLEPSTDEVTYLHEYTGWPDQMWEDVYPVNGPDFLRPGYWEDATHFIAALRFTCADEGIAGIYRLDVVNHTAERIGALDE